MTVAVPAIICVQVHRSQFEAKHSLCRERRIESDGWKAGTESALHWTHSVRMGFARQGLELLLIRATGKGLVEGHVGKKKTIKMRDAPSNAPLFCGVCVTYVARPEVNRTVYTRSSLSSKLIPDFSSAS